MPPNASASSEAAHLVAEARETLSQAEARRVDDPQVNPVRVLAWNLTSRLERGTLSLAALGEAAKAVGDALAGARAVRLRRYAGPELNAAGLDDVRAHLERLADAGWEAFAAALARPQAGVVFTAHPTFACSSQLYEALAARAEARDPDAIRASEAAIAAAPHAPQGDVSLAEEHAQARAALTAAKDAHDALVGLVGAVAAKRFPDHWRTLTPQLASLATWVGYDLDGRTDIHWSQSLRFRLEEKAEGLRRLAARLAKAADVATGADKTHPDDAAAPAVRALAKAISQRARRAATLAEGFAGDLTDPTIAAAAANALTRASAQEPATLDAERATLDSLIDQSGESLALELWRVRADMAQSGLGVGLIHMRVNAAQITNAVREDLGVDLEARGGARLARERAQAAVAGAAVRTINFASVFMERTTARRQFMLTAQILKHIDAEAPIRFLIAETEEASTALAALYLAKLYGVADKVDISPLFETLDALRRGGRLVEQLLDSEEYLDYVRTRGRMAIQIGFSDSGRFMGQIAAGLAAERLQILVARALQARKITDVQVVIFNTHGESMGRGAHPAGLQERLDYVMTPWAKARYGLAHVPFVHETSFQGGDGYLHFATPALAEATMARIAAVALSRAEADRGDQFYRDINFSWDFFQALIAWQTELYDDADYRAALGAFGRGLLVTTGSRKAKRQSDVAAAEGPRSLRAIPHNAILQQLGAPFNVAGGVGAASALEAERLSEMARESARARLVLGMAAASRQRASVPALRAIAAVFDPSVWSARAFAPVNGAQGPLTRACAARIAERLAPAARTGAYARLANRAAADFAKFDALLALGGLAPDDPEGPAAREALHVLHAMRSALLQRAFVLIAQTPEFSPRHDVTKDDLIDLVLDMRIEEAVALLRRIFPDASADAAFLEAIEEPADDAASHVGGYTDVRDQVIAPLEETAGLIRAVGVYIAHAFGAYG